ncbi:hypothetical protein [Dokdonella soli]
MPAYRVLSAAVLCCLLVIPSLPVHADSAKGELFAPGVISSALQETSATFTPDGDTVYFMRSDFAEANTTILESHRSGHAWSTPVVAPFSGEWHDSEPALSPDGKRLYFVSNRPPAPGGAPVTAEMNGQHFPGTNLWYVERGRDGRWSAPLHVDGELNRGAMLYNPSIANNGDLYFSAHRDDSGSAYQIYVAHRNGAGYSNPERVDLGDVTHNRMDPGIDPEQRFLVYAGNEGDSLGSADIYIAFRDKDGRWSKPEHLGGGVNSPALENAPVLGRAFGELYVASQRGADVKFPKPRDDYASMMKTLESPLNGSRNIWRFDISDVLRAHGITR